jgi:hypothetical protein
VSAEAAPTLAASARAGARWTAGAFYANTAVRLAISVGLARLLAPADFGVMALTMAFIGFVGLFQDSGLSSALVQHPDPVAPAASTAMVLTATGGILLGAASWALAPWVAGFMENEAVGPVLGCSPSCSSSAASRPRAVPSCSERSGSGRSPAAIWRARRPTGRSASRSRAPASASGRS